MRQLYVDGNDVVNRKLTSRPWVTCATLRNAGAADQSCTDTAGAGSYPVVGDWDGDEVDSVGVKLGTTWSLRNGAGGGAVEVAFSFGLANDLPVAWAGPVDPS